MSPLPARTQQLYDLLFGRGDVPVADIYAAMGGPADAAYTKAQWLGPYVTRLNRRLKAEGMRVKPGKMKGAYCLVRST